MFECQTQGRVSTTEETKRRSNIKFEIQITKREFEFNKLHEIVDLVDYTTRNLLIHDAAISSRINKKKCHKTVFVTTSKFFMY